jgi:hypothetical protein
MGVYDKLSPWASNEERLVTEALIANTAPSDEIADMVRPPLAQIRIFPPLFGFVPYNQRQATIDDVLGEDRRPADFRSSLSGGEAGWQASARFVNGAY